MIVCMRKVIVKPGVEATCVHLKLALSIFLNS